MSYRIKPCTPVLTREPSDEFIVNIHRAQDREYRVCSEKYIEELFDVRLKFDYSLF